jgi:hypothetical protein
MCVAHQTPNWLNDFSTEATFFCLTFYWPLFSLAAGIELAFANSIIQGASSAGCCLDFLHGI